MIKSIAPITAALCSLLLLICQIQVASALVNNVHIHRHRTSTIRWRSNSNRGPFIIQPMKASETATDNTVEDPVVNNKEEKAATATEPLGPSTTKEAWKPPSQKAATQGNNKIFKIQQPQDLLEFVVADERLSIVKVFASWCKTCKVFDVRYRKLAHQLGSGPVRFAEMQYDTPANEEMCKLLNATKLPYILIYRGSKGKVADFQCSPAKFQLLVDTVNDLLSDDGKNSVVALNGNSTVAVSNVTESSLDPQQQQLAKDDDADNSNVINALKEQLVLIEKEKIEMFELMKAQIEADKEEIAKMINAVKIQKSMIEERDEQIQKLSGVIDSKDGELAQKVKENQLLEKELQLSKSEVAAMTNRTAEAEKTISSLELKATIKEKEAKEKERQTKALWASWEKQKLMYEEERGSVRKMTALSVKSIKTKVRLFVSRK